MRTGQLGVTDLTRVCGLIVLLMLSISLSAQNRQGRTNTNTATAVLHIQVRVMPTVLSQKSQPQPASSSDISYIIPIVTNQNQTVMQETQLNQPANCTAASCSGILRTTTVVPH